MNVTDGDLSVRTIPDEPESWRMLAGWFDDPRVRAHYGGESHHYSVDEARAKYRPRATGEEPVHATFVIWQEDPVGYLQYYRVPDPTDYSLPSDHDVSDTWALDLFIGVPELWGIGLGSRAITLVMAHLFEAQGAYEILIDPIVGNERAVRAYEKCGFVHVGRITEHEEHDGVLHDAWLMRATVDTFASRGARTS